jgi:enterochelin esterase family protein
MKLLFTTVLVLFSWASCFSQSYSSFTQTVQNLYQLKTPAEINQAWNELVESENIPMVYKDSVAFLYRGDARSVVWMGDFNSWGYSKDFNNKGKRIPDTDIWILKTIFPEDARLDYKILINDENWILDPHNVDHQWSGVGGGSPNSELRMPMWKEDPLTVARVPGATQGKIEKDILLNSKAMGYQVTYSIYIPTGYKPNVTYPVVFVTDGYEYMHERMGNMTTILDNLIHLRKMKPVIAVFIDHREPVNRSNNRRMQELAMNEKYLGFVINELMPVVEKNYKISADPAQRAVMGTSMGGLSAAYFAFSKPEVFGLAGIQSPAFWFKPEIYTICENPEKPPVKTYLTTGMINDRDEGAFKMKALLDKNTCNYKFQQVNQGHSWGNWRDLIDDILIYFFPEG